MTNSKPVAHESDRIRPRAERVALLSDLTVPELVERLDHIESVAFTLGEHLADIAELLGLDRGAEDLAIAARARQLLSDPRARAILAADTELSGNTEREDRLRTDGVADAIRAVQRLVIFGKERNTQEFWAPAWRVDVQDAGRTLKLWGHSDASRPQNWNSF